MSRCVTCQQIQPVHLEHTWTNTKCVCKLRGTRYLVPSTWYQAAVDESTEEYGRYSSTREYVTDVENLIIREFETESVRLW